MRDRRGMLLALAALVLMFAPRHAGAATPLAVKLEFRADGACPAQQEFLRRLTSRAEVHLVDEAEALRLRVSLVSDSSGARGELVAGADGATDAREVQAGSCDEVTDALALIAALLIERTKRQQASRLTPAPPAAPPPRPIVALERAPTPRRVELGLEAIVTGPMTSTPLTGAGVSLFVAGGLTWWLSAHYSRNDVLAAPRAARLGFGGLVLGAGPPALNLGPRLQLAAALAAQGAFLSAEGVNVDVKASVRRGYWAVGALGRARLEVTSHVCLVAAVGGLAPLVERRFSTRDPYELVGQTSRVAPHAALGLALSL